MVETVTTSRDRRATAGKRMTALLGKAQEDDELFWSHDTWDSIEEASEDDSYNIEDEMEVNRIDVFDSDFNDSEEEEDEEEDHDEEQDERTKRVTTTKQPSSSAGGGEIYNKIAQYFHPSVVEAARIQFRSLAAAAPPQPSSQNALDTTVSTGTARALLIKKKSKEKQKKSIAGKEWNAGIVLHLPNSAQILENSLQKLKDMQHQLQQTQLQQQQTPERNDIAPRIDATDLQSLPNLSNIPTAISKTATAVILQEVCSKVSEVAVDTSTESISRKVVDTSKTNKSLAEAPRRNLRTKTLAHAQSAVQSQAKRAEEPRTTVPPLDKVPKLDKKHVPTQEEMLIEAANVTEAENERWILARQRFAARGGDGSTTSNKPSKKNNAVSTNRQVIQRFHSRRGCYNTITFPEMDLIPDCWKKHLNQQQNHTQPPSKTCIITGLPAKYRDPKTGYPYANLNAYKEIQRLYHHSTNKNIEKSSSTIFTKANTATETKKQPAAKKRPALKSEALKDKIAKDPLQSSTELPSMKKVKVDPESSTISDTRSVNLSVGAVTNNGNFSTDEITSTTIIESSAIPVDALMSSPTEQDPIPIIAVSSSAISSAKEGITAESNSKCTDKEKLNDVKQQNQQVEERMKEDEVNNNPEAATLENSCSAFTADKFVAGSC